MKRCSLIISLLLFIIGFSSTCFFIWNCYLGFSDSRRMIYAPYILFIFMPPGIMLWLTWRKEIKNWAIIPSVIFAACSTYASSQISFLPFWDNQHGIIPEIILYSLGRASFWLVPVIVFYGSLNTFRRFNNHARLQSAEHDSRPNGG